MVMVEVSVSLRAPPAPVFPLALVAIVRVTAPLAPAAGVKVGRVVAEAR